MKRFVALTLLLVLVFSLCACGGSGLNKAAVGTWELTGLVSGGEDYSSMLSMLGMTITLVLNEDGTGTMDAMGESIDIKWDNNSISSGEDSLPYTLDGDTLTLNEGEDVLTFTRSQD